MNCLFGISLSLSHSFSLTACLSLLCIDLLNLLSKTNEDFSKRALKIETSCLCLIFQWIWKKEESWMLNLQKRFFLPLSFVFIGCSQKLFKIIKIFRSTTLVLAYLMKYKNMCLKDAHDWVKSKRKVVKPNPGFWSQLIEFEIKLFGKSSVQIENQGK